MENSSIEIGEAAIKGYLGVLPATPGVYRMVNGEGDVLYVGKAKNLRKRVQSYTKPKRLSVRIRRMVSQTRTMEFVNTHTEAEALLLEANLIKKLAPRYNILLRDDKTLPSILISSHHDFPQVSKYRGGRKEVGEYFGPFASAGDVEKTLSVLQRAFLLRNCSDNTFSNRTRPCLLFQIGKCAGPCVGKIDKKAYANLVDQAKAFLRGESEKVQQSIVEEMEALSNNLKFEEAAIQRDRILAIRKLQMHQDINIPDVGEADIIALTQEGGLSCIQVFFIRGGGNYGNRAYYPRHPTDAEPHQIMEAFIGQFYSNKVPPTLILLSVNITHTELLTEALKKRGNKKVRIIVPQRGSKRKIVAFALENARAALSRKLVQGNSHRKLLSELGNTLQLDKKLRRIEVYDNSHTSGSDAVGAMIV
ncbi:MAG: excinuclease ABC subunit UvrC, partial [Pseudomonadota bacterium]|nr:excinuclease ABC subunit UvrC [Pseudomonadota bacterium]